MIQLCDNLNTNKKPLRIKSLRSDTKQDLRLVGLQYYLPRLKDDTADTSRPLYEIKPKVVEEPPPPLVLAKVPQQDDPELSPRRVKACILAQTKLSTDLASNIAGLRANMHT